MIRLNELIKEDRFKKIYDLDVNEIIISSCNIDEIFFVLQVLKITEIIIDLRTMFVICKYMGATSCKQINVLKTGKVDEYFGVKLFLE